MRIIPAIDILNGACVRLSEGKYDSAKTYYTNPVEVAQDWESKGCQYLHVVDLDGAKGKGIQNGEIVREICEKTNLVIDFGGGVKTKADVEFVLSKGVKQVTVGSLAVKNPEVFKSWIAEFGADKFILGADCKDGKIAVQGWTEETDLSVFDFIDYYNRQGIENVVCTDISKDGMLQGPSLDLYREILKQKPKLNLIASGGVSSMEDLKALEELGCEGAIVGKAIYEGKIDINELFALC